MIALEVGCRVTTSYPPHKARGILVAIEGTTGRVDWDTGARKSISPAKPGARILYNHELSSLRRLTPDEEEPR